MVKQPDVITGNVNSSNLLNTLMNVFNLAVKAGEMDPELKMQPFDAFSMGVVMAYLSERKEDFDAFVAEKDI